MHIIDSHFHWWPRSIFEALCKRDGFPRAWPNDTGGYDYWRADTKEPWLKLGGIWFDMDRQLAQMDALGHDVDVICSTGPFSLHFSEVPVAEGREAAMLWNREMADAQKKYPGRVWATGIVPLTDAAVALEVLNNAIVELGLIGINIPGSIGKDPNIDAARFEPFYARVAELGVPLLLHPTDAIFSDILDGYNGALHLSLGRVMEVSAAASRLIFAGILERHPTLKIFMSHTGGALPYQSGRMDKNGRFAGLPKKTSEYIRSMYTDTVSPHALGIKFATEYYGTGHVLYGSDNPCWNPAEALRLFNEIGLPAADQKKIFSGNAAQLFGLGWPARDVSKKAAAE